MEGSSNLQLGREGKVETKVSRVREREERGSMAERRGGGLCVSFVAGFRLQ